jgi:tetratricopeptide (TPR) repeat protein
VKEDKAKKDEYQKALSIYGDALREFRKEKYEKAEELLRAFIEKCPSEKELVDRARMYIAICEERLKGTRETISLKTFDDYFHYSVYRMNSGDYEEAQKLIEKAIKLNPQDAKIYYLQAILACRREQTEEALDHLKKAIQMDKFFRILAQNEADFQPLWEDKKFKLITRMT